MIRAVVIAALLSLSAQAKKAPPPPAPPTPPSAPEPPPPPDADDDDDDRDLFARAFPGEDDDEDEDAPQAEQPEERDENGNHVRVYRLKHEMRKLKHMFRNRAPRARHWSDDSWDDDSAAQAKGTGSASLAVSGPVTFRLTAQAGDMEITSGDKAQVLVALKEAPAQNIALHLFGDRVEVSFGGRSQLRRGKLHVELPPGSRVELTSMSGDITVSKVSGDVRIHTMSGDVKLQQVGKAEVQTISGDAHVMEASGPVRLHTVSGHAIVTATGATPQLEFQSASGDLDWSGLCARDCHVSAETVSGVVRLAIDPRSSFELSYSSHSGEMRDEVDLAVKHSPRRKHGTMGGWLEATYGKGEGLIEADAFSGNLVVKKK